MKHKISLSTLLIAVLGALGTAGAQAIPNNVTFRNYFGPATGGSGSSLLFNRPVLFTQYPDEDSAHIVLQQSGRIITVRRVGGEWAKTDSASFTVLNGTSGGSEQGLLGFAFHPNYRQNRKYYVYYIASGSTAGGFDILAERIADSTLRPKTIDAQRTLLRIADYANNHNGGTLHFGTDGKLYISLGDGGDANDAGNRAQNLDTLYGKILRLDVDGADAFPADTTRNYAIPADNPFVGMAGRKGEIWAYGLRNPWKWSFHPVTGEFWVGDVGQNTYEEVSRVPKGGNMGWRLREAAFCFNPSTNCSTPADSLVAPAVTIQRSHGQSITGGVFFTGDHTSAYHGVYIFGDYATDHVWAMRRLGGTLTDSTRIGQVFNVTSFDRDSRGRVFASSLSSTSSVAANNGIVYILESPDMVMAPVSVRSPRSGSRAALTPLRMADFLRHPGRYEMRGLDGRALRNPLPGAMLVREKGSAAPARLVTVLP
jgi:glucose/arabinose dehydrogenase